jgi:hypothetical protein
LAKKVSKLKITSIASLIGERDRVMMCPRTARQEMCYSVVKPPSVHEFFHSEDFLNHPKPHGRDHKAGRTNEIEGDPTDLVVIVDSDNFLELVTEITTPYKPHQHAHGTPISAKCEGS